MSALSVTERRWRDETDKLASEQGRLLASYADAALEFGPERVLTLAREQLGDEFGDALHEDLIDCRGWSLTNGHWHNDDDTWQEAA